MNIAVSNVCCWDKFTVIMSIEKSKDLFWQCVGNIKLCIVFSNIFACKLAWRKMNIFFINMWKYFLISSNGFLNGDVWRKFLYTFNTQSAWEVTLYCGVACVLGMVKFTISTQCMNMLWPFIAHQETQPFFLNFIIYRLLWHIFSRNQWNFKSIGLKLFSHKYRLYAESWHVRKRAHIPVGEQILQLPKELDVRPHLYQMGWVSWFLSQISSFLAKSCLHYNVHLLFNWLSHWPIRVSWWYKSTNYSCYTFMFE